MLWFINSYSKFHLSYFQTNLYILDILIWNRSKEDGRKRWRRSPIKHQSLFRIASTSSRITENAVGWRWWTWKYWLCGNGEQRGRRGKGPESIIGVGKGEGRARRRGWGSYFEGGTRRTDFWVREGMDHKGGDDAEDRWHLRFLRRADSQV